MFALVKYLDNNSVDIIETKKIVNFSKEIDKKRKYFIQRDAHNSVRGLIAAVGDRNELSNFKKFGRLRFPPGKQLISSTAESSSADDSDATQLISEHNKKREETINEITEKNIKKNLNIDHNIAGGSMSSDSESFVPMEEFLKLKTENEDLRKQVKALTLQNMRTQLTMSRKMDELQQSFEEMKEDTKEMLESKLNCVLGNTNQHSNPSIGTRVMDRIFLGNDVWVEAAPFDKAFTCSKSNVNFLKNYAITLFGVETLKQSSVTGKVSNRWKGIPKPELDPHLLRALRNAYKYYMLQNDVGKEIISKNLRQMNHHLSRKIADLNKKCPEINYNDDIVEDTDEELFDF